MRLEFQKECLKFLAQSKEAKNYLETIEADLFDDGYDYLAFCLIKGFWKEYSYQPTRLELLELLDEDSKEKKVENDIKLSIEKSILHAYKPLESHEEVIKEKIIEQYQAKLLKNLFKEKASKIGKESEGSAEAIFREVSRIKQLSDFDLDAQEANRGRFLLAEHEIKFRTDTVAHPTYLKGLNMLTASRGFKKPELIVFMSGPKRFKTGTILALAVNYVRDGKKVYYVDTENGHEAITDRAYQTMLGADYQELLTGKYDEVLTEMVERYKALGGDFKVDYYPSRQKSVADVKDELIRLQEEYNWIPDLIVWDNLDNMIPSTAYGKKKDRRLQIQDCYFEAIALQNELGCFGLNLSQVTREASSKRIITEQDFAEDFGKAANCHAAFAICQDEAEQKANVARICPVIQRQGEGASSGKACYVAMDKKKHILKEITYEEWSEAVSSFEVSAKEVKKGGRPSLKKLTDS